jgi:hypothetical protein
MDSIAFPVSFDSTGFKKLEEGSDDYYRQLLTLILLTEPDSLPLTPEFGVNDPSFDSIDRGLFILQAAEFVPEVTVTDIQIELDEVTGGSNVVFSFEVNE